MKIALVGAGGYGGLYCKELLLKMNCGIYEFVGIVDPNFNNSCDYKKEVLQQGINIYENIDELFKNEKCELTIISSPIFLHYEQVKKALEMGSHVLCEKPLTMSLSQYYELMNIAKEKNLLLSIGFQMPFSKGIKLLKKDIKLGKWGNPLRFKTIMLYKRFSDASWYGKMFSENGEPLFDSIAGNPGAHYIYNMFYCAEPNTLEMSMPKSVQAALFKATDTETCDISIMKLVDNNNVEFMYYGGTLATENKKIGPNFTYEFENGIINYDNEKKKMIGKFNDGIVKDYGNPFDNEAAKLWETIDIIKGEKQMPFIVESTLAHLLTIIAMHKSVPNALEIPITELEIVSGKPVVKNIDKLFLEAYDSFGFLSANWCKKGNVINIEKKGEDIWDFSHIQ